MTPIYIHPTVLAQPGGYTLIERRTGLRAIVSGHLMQLVPAIGRKPQGTAHNGPANPGPEAA